MPGQKGEMAIGLFFKQRHRDASFMKNEKLKALFLTIKIRKMTCPCKEVGDIN